MKMSGLVKFYSSNFENNPVTIYQGCGSLRSQKDYLDNVTKLVVSWVLMIGCSHVFSGSFNSVIQSCRTFTSGENELHHDDLSKAAKEMIGINVNFVKKRNKTNS